MIHDTSVTDHENWDSNGNGNTMINYGTLQHFQGWILFDMQRSGVQTARYSQQSFSHDLTKSYLWYLWKSFEVWSLKVISDAIGGSLMIPGAQCCNLQLSRQLAPASLHFISRCLGFLCSMAGCGWLTDTVVSSNREQTMVDSWLVWGPQFQETSKLMILCYKLLDSQETVLFGTINLIKH
jgi:hypothetical protein